MSLSIIWIVSRNQRLNEILYPTYIQAQRAHDNEARLLESMKTTSRSPEETDGLTLHCGDEHQIFERAQRCSRPTDLIVSPVELHQRNIQRRLREAGRSKDTFSFGDPVEIAIDLCTAANHDTTTIDRIDRLTLLRSILNAQSAEAQREISLPPEYAGVDPQPVEQLRTEVETATNFHPERIAAWRETATTLDAPVNHDTNAILDSAIQTEQALRDRTGNAISETELLRRATRSIQETDGSVWDATYPHIERLSLVGVSSLSAPHTDLVHAMLAATSVDVHIHFRAGTGEYLTNRVNELLGVEDPGREVFE